MYLFLISVLLTAKDVYDVVILVHCHHGNSVITQRLLIVDRWYFGVTDKGCNTVSRSWGVLTFCRFGMPCNGETKYIVLMYGAWGFQKCKEYRYT